LPPGWRGNPEADIAMSVSASTLTMLYGTSAGSNSLLATIYGLGTQSTGTSGQTPVQALRQVEQNKTQLVKATAAQPDVKTAIAAFTKAVNSAKSMTQLLSNPAVMNVLLTANGMSDQIGYTAFATKTLTSNLSDSNSLANTLSDTRWKTLAQTYNFAANGLKSIQNAMAIAKIANAYATAVWQKNEDSVTPGLSNALAFKAQASSITSVDQILGNMTLRTVVTTALGIPQQIAFQSLNAQEKAIGTRLDVTKFQDPKFVDSFVQRYLVAASGSASSSSTTATSLMSLALQARSTRA
jgi:Protein of unknown function (DUF1217)